MDTKWEPKSTQNRLWGGPGSEGVRQRSPRLSRVPSGSHFRDFYLYFDVSPCVYYVFHVKTDVSPCVFDDSTLRFLVVLGRVILPIFWGRVRLYKRGKKTETEKFAIVVPLE